MFISGNKNKYNKLAAVIAVCLPLYAAAGTDISPGSAAGAYVTSGSISPNPAPRPDKNADPHRDKLPIPDDTNDYGRMRISTDISRYSTSGTLKNVDNLQSGGVSGSNDKYVLDAKTTDYSDNNITPIIAKGEMNYIDKTGKEHIRPYEVSTDSVTETFEALSNMKEKLRQDVFDEAVETASNYGSIAAPKSWGADTTVGEIHARDVNGKKEFFEAKFNGNAKSKSWYYPENKKDNAWWRVVHPVEYYAITSDWHFGEVGTYVPHNMTPAQNNFKKIDAINKLKGKYGDAFRGTIINGDITHWGHGGEWSDAKEAFGKLNAPFWYGLGNHDYDGNVNDCGLWENRCAIRSIRNLVDHINSRKDVVSVDYDVMNGYKFPTLSTNYIGSFSYSFDIAGIRFIQLNNALGYTKDISGFNSDTARNYDIKVRSGEGWYRDQLRDARLKGKAAIVLEHGGDSYNDDAPSARQLKDEYDGSMILKGDTHILTSSNSGVAFRGDMLILALDYNKQTATTYMVGDDDIDEMSFGQELPLKFHVREIAPTTKSFVLSLRNKGGYTGYYRVTYTNSSTKSNFNQEYKLYLGNTKQIIIPAEATNVKVKGVTGTGRALYTQSLTKQENTCIETWGTLPRNLHWGWCN